MGNGRSSLLFEKAKALIPGGVNSPVRAWKAVGGTPLFIREGRGSKIYDVDGREYIDFISSWGPMILGHSHPAVVRAIEAACKRGTSFGAPTEGEIELAELIVKALPSVETVRLVNSGTEATMSAVRLARAFTKRNKIVKFDGCYHGHGDSLLAAAGSGVATFGISGAPGVPEAVTALTLSLPYNDIDAATRLIGREAGSIAAVIVEPVAGNMGVVPPEPGFLGTLRELTSAQGIILIFDEVITGFRLAWGGYQNIIGMSPDLTCLGKIVGGGLPIGAFGGRKDIMAMLAPEGPVYQAGTLSGNPIATAAGAATLKILGEGSSYEILEERSRLLCMEIETALSSAGIPVCCNRLGSMFTFFFTAERVRNYAGAREADTLRYTRYFHALAAEGIAMAPSQFEAAFLSLSHDENDLARTVEAVKKAIPSIF